jgi:CDP-6-deoxy-D-xylo-4-hexulose-3-dehydrase
MKNSFFAEAEVEKKLADFVLNEPMLSMGKYTEQFQEEFAGWHIRKHCVMVNSGSSANLLLMASLINLGRIEVGDRVGVSGVTWSTNIMPLIQLGLKPVLIDVEKDGVNINNETLSQEISTLKALFVTNVLGLSNSLSKIKHLCENHDVQLYEDNCEGLGCSQDNKLMGNFGVASTTSSFIGHHFSTIEGGYVFTDDDELAAMLKVVRAHGWTRNINHKEMEMLSIETVSDFQTPYTFEYCVFNLRPSEINAYCGIIQLPLIHKYNDIREKRFRIIAELAPNKIYANDSINPVFAIPIRAENLDEKNYFIEIFKAKEIECRPLISGSMGMQPFWKRIYGECPLKNASKVDECGLYITNDPQLSKSDFMRLVDSINEAIT